MNDSAVAAIKYALEKCDGPSDSMWFLKLWNGGDFESIREGYEDVPDEVFIDADPLFKSAASSPGYPALATIAPPRPAPPAAEAQQIQLVDSRRNRVYLAGPMTGYAEFNFPAFNAEAARLRSAGFDVVNPADHGIVDGAGWCDYLRYDIAQLSRCESIHFLPGWEKSKGALLERSIAVSLGMPMTFADHATAAPPAAGVPEGLREAMGKAASSWLYENDPQCLDWCDTCNVDALLDALFEAVPQLQLAKAEGV